VRPLFGGDVVLVLFLEITSDLLWLAILENLCHPLTQPLVLEYIFETWALAWVSLQNLLLKVDQLLGKMQRCILFLDSFVNVHVSQDRWVSLHPLRFLVDEWQAIGQIYEEADAKGPNIERLGVEIRLSELLRSIEWHSPRLN